MGVEKKDFIFLKIGRPPGSTQGGSSAASEVYKGQVGDGRFFFPSYGDRARRRRSAGPVCISNPDQHHAERN